MTKRQLQQSVTGNVEHDRMCATQINFKTGTVSFLEDVRLTNLNLVQAVMCLVSLVENPEWSNKT